MNESSCKKNLSTVADKRQIDHRIIKTHRGIIYDRNGEILAMSLPKKTLCINIEKINKLQKNKKINFTNLLKIIGMPENKFFNILKNHSNKKEYYLKRKINDDTAKDILELGLPYIYFIDEYHRVYLGGSYFSNILGFTDIDDNGQAGIEYSKNTELGAISGIKKVRKDNLGRSVELIELIKKPIPGEDIHLSLDKRIQFIGYNILKKYISNSQADSGSIVLIKTKTGEILSMINYPSFNPANRHEMTGPNIKNNVISTSFEPGSTMKPFTIYSALMNGSYKENSTIDTSPGKMKVDEHEIEDYADLGLLDLKGIIAKSSNIGAAVISLNTNQKDIYDTLNALDFGNSLYIDLIGEEQGKLSHYSHWSKAQHASIGYGYGLSTTLLHLANAYTIVANYGKKVQLTYQKVDNEDIYYEDILDEDISKKIIKMMTAVVDSGTGKNAKLDKYSVAGKTGTVRMNIKGAYKKNNHLALFVGIVPSVNPEYVAAIIVRNPRNGPASGGKNAAPIFKEFMNHSLNLLKVYPDKK